MKNRKSFVTNSSSSSFIVTSKVKYDTLPVKLAFDYDLMKSIDDTFVDIQKFKEYFEEMHGTSESWSDHNCKEFAKCMSTLCDGGVVYCGSVGNDYDEPISIMLYEVGFKNVTLDAGMELISYDY